MAEGDTIRRLAEGLTEALGGTSPLVEFRFSGRRAAGVPLPGERLDEIRARGKHLLMRFTRGSTLHTHLGMTGSWRVGATSDASGAPREGVRALVETRDAVAVCIRAPVVELLDDAGLRGHPVLARLGPDLCDAEPDLDEALLRLSRSDPGRSIGEALLDQRIAAGIGNVYRSEVLWACRVDPFRPATSVSDEEGRSLFRTGHEQLRRNLGPGPRRTTSRGLAVYGRARNACPRCAARIRVGRIGEQARSVWWCPNCQPPATRSA